MTATAKAARPSGRAHSAQARPRLRAVKRRVIEIDSAQLNRAVQAINRADKRDDWFEFLRSVE